MKLSPVLKKLHECIKSHKAFLKPKEIIQFNSEIESVSEQEANVIFQKLLADKCLKLKFPISIPAGTKWSFKTKSSTTGILSGKFKYKCNIIGIIKVSIDVAVLDIPSNNDPQNDPSGKSSLPLIQLNALDNETLEQIAKQF